MKRFFLVVSALALTGCMNAEPSPAMVRLQSACDAGNLDACGQIVSAEEGRRAAFLAYMASRPVDVYQPVQRGGVVSALNALPGHPYVPPIQRTGPIMTNCRSDMMGGMRCTTY